MKVVYKKFLYVNLKFLSFSLMSAVLEKFNSESTFALIFPNSSLGKEKSCYWIT